jgi:3-phosphoshikimate 1-carboxyvinyltransferase
MRAEKSSQPLSGLLLVAPLAENGIEITVEGELFSRPYIDITLRMMEQWSVILQQENLLHFQVPGQQKYRAQNYVIEPDASGASYFWAAAAVTGGRVRVEGIGRDSLQGDAAFVDVLEQMGCAVERGEDYIEVRGVANLRGVDVDMNAISDTVMTLAAIAPFADGPTNIRNVAHIQHKESERISNTVRELQRLGVRVDERHDGMTIHPATQLQAAQIETYRDHRMAMSFAITGLRAPGVTILDPGCVAKTFPDFFSRLDSLCQPARVRSA